MSSARTITTVLFGADGRAVTDPADARGGEVRHTVGGVVVRRVALVPGTATPVWRDPGTASGEPDDYDTAKNTWDVYHDDGTGQLRKVTTVAQLLDLLRPAPDEQRAALEHLTTLPSWRAAPEELKAEMARWLDAPDGRAVAWTRAGLQLKAVDPEFERLHPRDRNGRFIKVGGRVRISAVAGGGDGTVMGLGDAGMINVKRDNGTVVALSKGYLTVLDANGQPPPPPPPPHEKDAARLADHGVPAVTVPTVEVPPLAAAQPAQPAEPAESVQAPAAPRASALKGAKGYKTLAKDQAAKWADDLGDDPLATAIGAAMEHYQGYEGYRQINGALRDGPPPPPPPETDVLDEAFADERAVLDRDVIAYRGISDWGRQRELLKVGAEIADDGFQSTSLDPDIAKFFSTYGGGTGEPAIITLKIPAGSRALPPDVFTGNTGAESELLLPRGTRYRVASVKTGPDGVPRVELEVTATPSRGSTP